MIDLTDQSAASVPSRLTKVPIAQLSPTLEAADRKCVSAIVTLVWPYSSSTKSLSLLLAEPDFRLRRSHGQVKVVFCGRVAEKVAASHVGIGDTVKLGLKGAEYAANDNTSQTPGRNVAWDVHIANSVSLEVNRPSQSSSTIVIEENDQGPHQPEQLPPSTPRVVTTNPDTDILQAPESWESPAFMRRSSHNFVSTFDTPFDSAPEEDGSVPGKGRKRPRYSFQRDDWHVVDEPMDSEEDQPVQDWWENTDQIIAHEPEEFADDKAAEDSSPLDITQVVAQSNRNEHSPGEPPVFIKPSLDTSRGLFGLQMSSSNTPAASFEDRLRSSINLPTDTPHLKPIPSPGLPIPSPIVSGHGNSQGYFSTNDLPKHAQTLPPAAPPADLVESLADPNASVHFMPIFPLGEPSRDSEGIESDKNYNSSHGNTDDPAPQQPSPLAPEKIPYPRTDGFLHVSEDFGLVQNNLAVSTDPHMDAEIPQYPSAPTTEPAIQDQVFESPHIMGDMISIDHGDTMPDDELKHISEALQTAQGLTRPGHREQRDVEFADSQSQELQSEQEPEHSDQGNLTRGYPSTEQVEYPGLHSSREEGSEIASEISDQEQDVDMDDQTNESAGFEDDDEQEEETPTEGEAESETAELPRPPPAQAEVIVLDSDSEDELASDNSHTHRDTRINANMEDDVSDDGEEGDIDNEDVEKRWSEAEQDNRDDSDVEDSESEGSALGYDERVHDSDREDESSVDVLARDHYPEIQHSRGSSVEYESDEQDEESEEGVPAEDDHSANRGSALASKQESIIVLDSDEEEPEEEEEEEEEEDEPLQETTSPSEEKPRIMNTLDGTLDDDFVNNDYNYSEHKDEPSMPSENIEDAQGLLMRPFEHQLPTPDPTQENTAHPSNDEPKDMSKTSLKYSESESHESSPEEANAATNTTEIAPVGLMAKGVEISLPLESTHDSEAEDNISNQDDQRGEFATVVKQSSETLVDPQNSAEEALMEPPSIVINQLPFPDRNAHGLRSKLSYFAPLATLIDHYNALVDTISVVHDVSPVGQAASGPKEHYVTIQVTDPSMAGTIVQAQIFRAHRSAIPSLGEGDAVLLRNFRVRSYDHCIMLISVETSSWAVFDGSSHEPRVEGPPVEYGNEEQSYAAELRTWYSDAGAAMIADHELQFSIHEDNIDTQLSPGSPGSVIFSESGSIESISRGGHKRSPRGSRRRRSHRRVTIHELRDGRRYTEVGSPSSKESIHELRDGTVYANL